MFGSLRIWTLPWNGQISHAGFSENMDIQLKWSNQSCWIHGECGHAAEMVKSVMLDSLRMLTPSWNGHTSHVRFIQTETVKSFMLSRSERRQLSRAGFTQNVDTPLKLSNESWSMYHRECARADRWNCQLNLLYMQSRLWTYRRNGGINQAGLTRNVDLSLKL